MKIVSKLFIWSKSILSYHEMREKNLLCIWNLPRKRKNKKNEVLVYPRGLKLELLGLETLFSDYALIGFLLVWFIELWVVPSKSSFIFFGGWFHEYSIVHITKKFSSSRPTFILKKILVFSTKKSFEFCKLFYTKSNISIRFYLQ